MKNIVRELRTESHLSQQQLGNRIGVSRQAIIAIENYKFDPSLKVALKLARVFNHSVESIFLLDDLF